MELKSIHEKIRDYMYLESLDDLDITLATTLSRQQLRQKLWVILVGESGDAKSMLLSLFDAGEDMKKILNLTSSALISGKKKNNHKIEELRNKVILIPEFAEILSLPKDSKEAIFAQFRNIYDGECAKINGNGMDMKYEDLNITLIAGSTFAIKNQIILANVLGTRELLFCTHDKDDDKTLQFMMETENKRKLRDELRNDIKEFIKERKYEEKELPLEISKKLIAWSKLATYLRANALTNSKGELLSDVHREKPTRIFNQLLVLYHSLKSLSSDYTDEKAMEIIRKCVFSSAHEIRAKVLVNMIVLHCVQETWNKREIAEYAKVHYNTCLGQLEALHNLGLLEKKGFPVLDFNGTPSQEGRQYYRFSLVKGNDIIRFLAKELCVQLNEMITNEPLDTGHSST